MSENKIIQIVAIDPGWYAVYDVDGEKPIRSPLVCIALFSDGDLQFMDASEDGLISEVTETRNFLRIGHEKDNKEVEAKDG